MLEADEVHRRAVHLQFQGRAVEGNVELGDAMLVLAEAAVFMFVVGLGREGQQGDSEEQGAHGRLRSDE